MSRAVFTTLLLCLSSAGAKEYHSPKAFIDHLFLSNDDFKDAFAGLDVDGADNMIDKDDLNILYFHKDAEFAKFKFLQLIDTQTVSSSVDIQELTSFMRKDAVKLAVHECTYIRSQTIRRICFADQILTYVYQVMDQQAMQDFFNFMESPTKKDGKLDIEELEALNNYLPGFCRTEAKHLLLEIAGDAEAVDLNSFKEYVMREDILSYFRECRKEVTGNAGVYNSTCLAVALGSYSKKHLTELHVALTFHKFDAVNPDFNIRFEDVKEATKGTDDAVWNFFYIVDLSRDGIITYGEFRAYVYSHTIHLHIERDCIAKENDLEKRLACITTKVFDFTKDNHSPMWLTLPDLDMLLVFEDLDHSDNGLVEMHKDLVEGKRWEEALALKLAREMDGPEEHVLVNLQEFQEYVFEPNMIYGMADCLDIKKGQERLDCYVDEMKEIISTVLEQPDVDRFFDMYDKGKDGEVTEQDVKDAGVTDPIMLQNFLAELGMGDEIITRYEFRWFVKQQELSGMFGKDIRDKPEELHKVLLTYLDKIMTEFDTQMLFRILDPKREFLLDQSQVGCQNNFDKDGKISFTGFWLFLNTPRTLTGGTPRKRQLESKCTVEHKEQDKLVNCYKENILFVK